MSLPASILSSLGQDLQLAQEDSSWRQEQQTRLGTKRAQEGRILRFNRGNEASATAENRDLTVSQVGDGLPYAALIRALLEREAIQGARDLLALALGLFPADPELLRINKILAPPRVRRSPVRDHDRSPDFRWLREEGPRHRGFWVALEDGKLLAEAPVLKELLDQLKAIAPARLPLVHRIG